VAGRGLPGRPFRISANGDYLEAGVISRRRDRRMTTKERLHHLIDVLPESDHA
jgi:hypothetical protein